MSRNKPYRRLLMVCEGQTEYQYTLALKQTLSRELQRGIQIEISMSSDTSALQLINEARELMLLAKRDKNPYEIVWLFFDHDNQPNLAEVFMKIKQWGLQAAYSAICLEHWFLLFFEDNRRSFRNAEEVIHYLKQRHWPTYHKTKINHYELLKDRLPLAMERAAFIKQQVDHSIPINEWNPFFTLHEFIAFFDELREGHKSNRV